MGEEEGLCAGEAVTEVSGGDAERAKWQVRQGRAPEWDQQKARLTGVQ